MKDKKSKAQAKEKKGDQHYAKGEFTKALKAYRAAQELDPDHPDIYDKLVETHGKNSLTWSPEDFALSLDWTMKKQELADPKFKRLHAKLEPEWKEIADLIGQMMRTTDEKKETELVEQIFFYKERAIYPLVEIILSLKKFNIAPKA